MKTSNLSHSLSRLYFDRYRWSDDAPKGIENIILNSKNFVLVVKDEEWALSECSTIGNNGYNYPEQVRITNPYLKNFQGTYDLQKDNVLYFENKITLDEIVDYYSEFIQESDITNKNYLFNLRIPFILVSQDNKTVNEFNNFLKKLKDGVLSMITTKDILADTKVFHSETSKNALEIRQYYLSEFYNLLGVQEVKTMKKERLINSEIQADSDGKTYFLDYHDEIREEIVAFLTKNGFETTCEILERGDFNAINQSTDEIK
ncbi:MAG: hypothetical protein MJ250_08470 [Alphaproteobacteria bacterium]|nr:hypothetical protein [Alphaproteobacteria bacterium]